jgi:HK97 family phage prohead protease
MKRSIPKLGDMLFRAGDIVLGEGDSRTATFVASEEKMDRYGDIVSVEGWDLKNFKNNPVLLWGHKSSELPIGKVSKIGVEKGRLIADAEFATADVNPFADTVFKMVKAKLLRAVSVGFRLLAPPEPILDADKRLMGFRYVAQELLELSVVSVPALPSALNVAKSLHVPEGDYQKLFHDDQSDDGASAVHAMRSRELDFIRLRG